MGPLKVIFIFFCYLEQFVDCFTMKHRKRYQAKNVTTVTKTSHDLSTNVNKGGLGFPEKNEEQLPHLNRSYKHMLDNFLVRNDSFSSNHREILISKKLYSNLLLVMDSIYENEESRNIMTTDTTTILGLLTLATLLLKSIVDPLDTSDEARGAL